MEASGMDWDYDYEIIIASEITDEIKAGLAEGDLSKAVEAIGKSLETIERIPLNIAVTGESGVGKSTFINAIRGLEDDEEEGAAKTGVVETTSKATPYSHPDYKNVTFWDLPGIGTPNFRAQEYLEAVNFSRYDFFIIMASERFRQNDAELAREIQAMEKRFYFVRAKVDCDLAASKIRRKKSYDAEKTPKEIRDNCVENLLKEKIQNPRVFLLSCLELDKFDFVLMQDILAKELPSNKRHAFLLSLPNISKPILEKKRDELKKDIWKWTLLSCAATAVPIPGLSVACDVTILLAAMSEYRNTFGLNPTSLEKLANKYGKALSELKSVIRSPLVLQKNNEELVKALLFKFGPVKLVTSILSTIPLIGSVVASGLSFDTIYKMLSDFLEEITEDAVRVLRKAAEISF